MANRHKPRPVSLTAVLTVRKREHQNHLQRRNQRRNLHKPPSPHQEKLNTFILSSPLTINTKGAPCARHLLIKARLTKGITLSAPPVLGPLSFLETQTV